MSRSPEYLERHARYMREHPTHGAKATARRYENVDRLRAIKTERGCVDCGFNAHQSALHFDHVRDTKRFNLSLPGARKWSTIESELAKCEVRCANCHAIRTFQSRVYDRKKES